MIAGSPASCDVVKVAQHSIEAGDVMAMNTVVLPFVLLVMAKDEEPDPTYGAKVYFRWLAHPEAEKITACEWMWEKSLRSMEVWQKVASATCSLSESVNCNALSTSHEGLCQMSRHTSVRRPGVKRRCFEASMFA
jgi:hypothetical protein